MSLLSQNMTDIYSFLHETAFLSAIVEAFPLPATENFTWSKCEENGPCQTLQTDEFYIVHAEKLQTDLIIKEVRNSDYGQYRLVVSNGIGDPLEAVFHLSQSGMILLMDDANCY